MVLIRFHGILREESNIKEVEVGDGYINEILNALPEGVKGVINKYSRYLLILVNGKRVYSTDKLLVSNGDVVDLTLPAGGG